MKKQLKKTLTLITLTTTALSLTNCAAISTAIKHRNLVVDSKVSETIFLEPVGQADKTIYVQVKNTLGSSFDGFKQFIVDDLERNGWVVVGDLDKAHNMVQVNVLQAGQAQSPESAYASLVSGFGGDLATGALAGVAAGYAMNSVGGGLGVGAAVSGVSWITNSLVENVTYSMITDVQVSIRVDGEVTQTTQASLAQGNSTATKQTYNQKSNWLKYRTRIVSTANQVNLEFEEAKPELQAQIARQIAGIFGS